MRVHSPAELHDILDHDRIWRRMELTTLIVTMKAADAAAKVALRRAIVPLLYAHWEGFGRLCFQRYLELISYKNLRFKELQPAFHYMKSLGMLQEVANAPASVGIKLMPQIISSQENINRDPFKRMIDTKNNLRFDVLLQLLSLSGVDSMEFTNEETFINKELCDPRNAIAHGHSACPNEPDLLRRRDRVFQLMEKLQTTLVNAALTEAFRRSDP